MFKCYTLENTLTEGIYTPRFSCFLTDIQRAFCADMHMLPVLSPDDTSSGMVQPTLAFLTGYDKRDTRTDSGTIVCVDTRTWHLGSDMNPPVLLDTGENGYALIFVPPMSRHILVKDSHEPKVDTFSTDTGGVPSIASVARGRLLLFSLGHEFIQALPELSQAAPEAVHTTDKSGKRTTQPAKSRSRSGRRKSQGSLQDA